MAWTQQEIIDNSRGLYAAFIRAQGVVACRDPKEARAFVAYLTDAMATFMFKDMDTNTGQMDEISMGLAGAWSSVMNLVSLGARGKSVDWVRLYDELLTIVPQMEIAEKLAKGLFDDSVNEEYLATFSAMLGRPSRRNQNAAAA
jgi:hypothetical protein